MTRLLLIRHAESEWNAQGRWQGQADPDLSDRGRALAHAAAERLTDQIGRIVSSDLKRASATADIIGAVLGLRPTADPALREIDVGDWSGLTTPEIEERWPGALERWRRGEEPASGGEEREEFRRRVMAAVMNHGESSNGSLLVVTHGAAIGVIERHLGVHPGVPVPGLSGRWFELSDGLRAISDRVSLLPGDA